MSPYRLWSIFPIVLLVFFVGGASVNFAQTEERPIYLHTGQGDSKVFNWGRNSSKRATVYIFRESVSEKKPGGRLIGATVAEVKQRLPQEVEKYRGTTTLTKRTHPGFGTTALSTEATYLAEGMRYFLLIEEGEDLYMSRTRFERSGNLPRYYTFGKPANVRVGQIHPEFQSSVEKLLRRVEQQAVVRKNDKSGREDSSSEESKTASHTTSPAPESSEASSVGVALSWPARLRLLKDVLYFVILVVGIGGAFVFALNYFLDEQPSETRNNAGGNEYAETGGDGETVNIKSGQKASIKEEAFYTVEDSVESPDMPPLLGETAELQPATNEKRDVQSSEAVDQEKPLRSSPLGKGGDTRSIEEPSSSDRRQILNEVLPAFEEWCQRDRALKSMVSRFERFLEEDGVGEVSIESTSVEDGNYVARTSPSEATHWVVRLDRQPVVLLPRPGKAGFYSLDGFEGSVHPKKLGKIAPAWLIRREKTIEILETGQVSRAE